MTCNLTLRRCDWSTSLAEGLTFVAAVLRHQCSFGHVDLWPRDQRPLELGNRFTAITASGER